MIPLAVALAQAAPSAPAPRSDDIVVEGVRDLDAVPGSRVTRRTVGGTRTAAGARASVDAFARAERYARCVMAAGPDPALLRDALDTTINSTRQQFAQAQLVVRYQACTQDPTVALRSGIAFVSRFYDPVYYTRGALFVEVLRRHAPDAELTAARTADPAVQARFDARQIPLARFRLPADRTYFEMAVCLVRVQPELSTRLVRMPIGDRMLSSVEAAIVNGAPECVGHARKVYFDPMQFRMYIADALYRWIVADRGTATLIRP